MVFEINLLPEKYRKRKIAINLDARLLGIVAGVALVAFLGWTTLNQGRKLSSLQTQVMDMEAQRDMLAPRAQRVDRHRREIENLSQRIQTLQGLGGRNNIQLRILEIVRTQLPDDLWLLDINQAAPRQQRGAGAGIPRDRLLNFRGVAMRKERITEFISRLQKQDLIERVQTSYLRPTRVEDADIFEFFLTAILSTAG